MPRLINQPLDICNKLGLCVFAFDIHGELIFVSSEAKKTFKLVIGEKLIGYNSVFFDVIFALVSKLEEGQLFERLFNTFIEEEAVKYHVKMFKDEFIYVCLTRYEDNNQHCFSSVTVEEKMASMGRLSNGIAHNLKSPLMTLRNISDYMSMVILKWNGLLDETHLDCPFKNGRAAIGKLLKEMQKDIGSSVSVMTNIISSLRIYNKTDRLDDEQTINLVDLLRTVAKMAEYNAKMSSEIYLKCDFEEILLKCVPSDLQIVFVNLLENSIEQIIEQNIEEGIIDILVEKKEDVVKIVIRDNGGGINEKLLKRGELFEPFATYKVHGTGLGLHYCLKIIQEHDGEIFARNYVDGGVGGAEFLIKLPLKE